MEGQGWLCGEVGRRQTGAGVSWAVGESVVADRGDIHWHPPCLSVSLPARRGGSGSYIGSGRGRPVEARQGPCGGQQQQPGQRGRERSKARRERGVSEKVHCCLFVVEPIVNWSVGWLWVTGTRNLHRDGLSADAAVLCFYGLPPIR